MHLLFLNCFVILLFGYLTVTASTSINAIISLIFIFCDAAFILFNFGFDYLGLIFIIIYVGAIAVLFLFIIMMLNTKVTNTAKADKKYINNFLCFFMSCGIFVQLTSYVNFINPYGYFITSDYFLNVYCLVDKMNNIEMFGSYFYNFFNIFFLLAGIILLIALIGAVVLTINLNQNIGYYVKQLDSKQLAKNAHTLSFFKN